MQVLILGGGYTGQRLAQWLQARQIPVAITNRTGTPVPGLAVPTYQFSHGEPMVPLDPMALVGVTHVISTIAPGKDGVDPVIALLLHELQALNLQWFGYLSTTGVYGDTQGDWVDENSPLKSENLRSQHRINIDTQLRACPLPTHIFRLPGIYGPGRSIFERIKAGTVRHVHKPGHYFSRVHVDDIVQTVGQSMLHPQPGEVYNVSDDQPTETSRLVQEAYRLMGQAPPPAKPFSLEGLSPMAASFWSECRRVNNQKIKTDLGIQLIYPTYREGLQAIWQHLGQPSVQP